MSEISLAQHNQSAKNTSELPNWFIDSRLYRKARHLLQRQAQGAIFGNRQKRIIARYQQQAQALRGKGTAC